MKVLLITILLISASLVFSHDKAMDKTKNPETTKCSEDGATRWVKSTTVKKELLYLAKTSDRPDLSLPEPVKNKTDENKKWYKSKNITFPFQTITLYCMQEQTCKNGSWVKTGKCKMKKKVKDESRTFEPMQKGEYLNERDMSNYLGTCKKWFNFPGVVDEKQVEEKIAAFEAKCKENCK